MLSEREMGLPARRSNVKTGLARLKILSHPDYQGVVTQNWFSPDYWGDAAQRVASGGRGGAWFIESSTISAVLRHYLRGGLIARVSTSAYAYLGETGVRSFAEFRLLEMLHRQGLPVPKPIAACYWRTGVFWYRAAILVERLAGAQPFADRIPHLTEADWRSLGKVLRQFHDANVYHADLNCFNILVHSDSFYLIDFDKGEWRGGAGPEASWKSANLARLYRSLERLDWHEVPTPLQTLWTALEDGYHGRF